MLKDWEKTGWDVKPRFQKIFADKKSALEYAKTHIATRQRDNGIIDGIIIEKKNPKMLVWEDKKK